MHRTSSRAPAVTGSGSASSLVVIAASTGGVAALTELAAQLPPNFPAAVCMVLHIGNAPSLLPELLSARGHNPAVHPRDGQSLLPGTIYVAPPDYHMLVDRQVITLNRGPKENHVRPAADPLFRTAASSWGVRAIGVVLTGCLDDGTAGLLAIKACGGTAVVQDPATAVATSMPQSALAHVAIDHCVPLEEIASLLTRLVVGPFGMPRPNNAVLEREVAINRGERTAENLAALAAPSTLTCPACGGSLWEVRAEPALRFRCHTGHAYGALSLAQAQSVNTEHALRSSVRALRERELLLRRVAEVSASIGDKVQAESGRRQAELLSAQSLQLISLIEKDEEDEKARVGP